MGLRLLGPVELVLGDRTVDLGGPRQRVVLAVLGLNANRVVPVEQLIDTVWGESPPSTARAQIQICISALRKLLDDAAHPNAISTRPPGYVLELGPADVDTLRFAELVATAREQSAASRNAEAAETLRAALALWRGAALCGVPSDLVQRSATVLEEQRLAAIEERIRLDLALGRHREVVGELQALVADHPLRERLHEFLMLALYRAGRQAEALEAGRSARAVLVEEIGLEPGRELQDLELAILRRDPALGGGDQPEPGAAPRERAAVDQPQPASVVVPRQLPASIADFTGREEHLQEILRLLGGDQDRGQDRRRERDRDRDRDRDRGRGRGRELDADQGGSRRRNGGADGRGTRWAMPIVAISGKGGVGKSSLATRAAHELGTHYPHGQLYASMSASIGEDQIAKLLARFLRAMGVVGSAIPDDVEERAELYRSKLSGKRMLLVLDDVPGEAQLQPLLPGSPSCAVIATSRTRLSGLPGAHQVTLDVLDVDKSVELLTRIIGPKRVAAERDAVVELAELCGGLPLALRIAGARLASRPHWRVDGLVRRLRDEAGMLDEFTHRGLELRSNIGLTYRVLGEQARRLFRLCSLVPAPDFPGWAAAALLDTSDAEAEEVLESLVDAQLVDIVQYGDAAPRYRLHALIRVYAGEKLHEDETEDERAAALGRVLGAWLALAEEAHRREYGGDYTIVHGGAPRWRPPVPSYDHVAKPQDWWENERTALVAAVRRAAAVGLDELCWDLALTSVTLFEAKGYFDDWMECARVAYAAAERAGNRIGMAAMRYSLGTLHMFQTRLDEAEACFAEALALFLAEGQEHGYALVLRNVAHIDGLRGDTASMLTKYSRSLEIMRAVGDRIGEAHILRSLAKFRMDDGDIGTATRMLDEALATSRETGCLRVEVQVVHRFAELYLATDQVDRARQALHRVLRIVRDTGDPIGEVHTLYGLGLLRFREGRLDNAETTLVHALDLARRFGERLIEAKARYSLGEIALARGSEAGGVTHLQVARGLFDELGSAVWHARTLDLLAGVRVDRGDNVGARALVERAVMLLAGVGSRESAQLLARLHARLADEPVADDLDLV